MIKAIETAYRGNLFRSRLEARWAVFFHNAGIEYQYEPEGFKINDGEWLYLPDFFLPKSGTWVEVKGNLKDVSDNYLEMIACCVDWGGDLPGVADSFGESRGLLWLGEIPEVHAAAAPCHPIIQHYKGGWVSPSYFGSSGPLVSEKCTDFGFDSSCQDIVNLREGISVLSGVFHPTISLTARVEAAYRTARRARFEHGETPQ